MAPRQTSTRKASARKTPAAARPCPICGKPPVSEYTPFCSKRCADVDLHRWLGGVYAVPTDEQPGDADTRPPPDRDDH